MNKILLLTRDQEKFLSEVRWLWLQDCEFVAPETDEEIKKHIIDSNIICGIPYLINQHLYLAEKIQWIQSTFAWIDALVRDDLRQDYMLTNVKDVYGKIMAEYLLWYILNFEKSIIGNYKNQLKKIWDQKAYPSLDWKKIGIMWTWSIWWEIARILDMMWMQVIWYSRSWKQKKHFSQVYAHWELDIFLSQVDYVVSVLPNTHDTKHLCNKDFFKKMKSSAVFVNIGRWANVCEEDLIEAMKNKDIAAAVLDVFTIEPLPKKSQLWNLENVYITPHVSWYDENNQAILSILKDNYNRFLEGKPLLHIIDFNKGY